LAAPSGRIHIVWGRDDNRDYASDEILHSWSDDGGKTWSPPDSVAPLPNNTGPLFVIDPVMDVHDNVHVMMNWYSDFSSNANREFYETEWNANQQQWSKPNLFQKPGDYGADFDFTINPAGNTLYLVWPNKTVDGNDILMSTKRLF